MGKHLVKPYVEVNGTAVTGVRNATVNQGADDVEATTDDAEGKQHIVGLRDDSFDLEFAQNYADSEVDSVLYPLWDAGTQFELRVADGGGVISDANPAWVADVVITKYGPQDGAPGTLAALKVTAMAQQKIRKETS